MKHLLSILFLSSLVFINACKDKEETPSPVISSFTPEQGVAGTSVTISGSNFSPTASSNVVSFGTTVAIVTAATVNELKVNVPNGAVTAPITVKIGEKSVTSFNSFIVALPPTIGSFTPTQGPEGTDVTIAGTNFTSKTSDVVVKFGATAVTTIVDASPNQIRVKVPAGASSGSISVVIGSQAVTSSGSFTVIPTPMITSLFVNQGFVGDLVIIKGNNFGATQGANTVYLGSTAASITSSSTTELKVTVPSGAPDGKFVVLTNDIISAPSETFDVITTATVTTLAGSTQGFNDATSAAAKFDSPGYITRDAQNNIYISAELVSSVPYPYPNLDKIRKITPAGVVTTFVGTTTGSANGSSSVAQFNGAKGMAFDSRGNLFVAEWDNNRIRKVTPNGDVTTFAGSTSGNTNGNGTSAQFNHPVSVAIDANDNVYVLDRGNYQIRKITTAGAVTTLAGGSFGTTDGTGVAAQFQFPSAGIMIVDNSGNILVVDGNAIRKVTPAGVVTTIIPAGNFSYPNGLAIGPRNDLYVADFNNHRIQRVNYAGEISTLAGNNLNTSGDDGEGINASFHNPSGIVFDSQWNLYVADLYTHKVRKIVMK